MADQQPFDLDTIPAKADASGVFDLDQLPPAAPRSAVGELGTAVKRGALVDLPQMFGQALQYASTPGGAVYNFGKGVAESAAARGAGESYTLRPEQHGAVLNALAQGAEMAPVIAAPVAAAAGAVAALPVELPALASTAIVAGASALPFAGQAGQETLEKGEKAGVPEDAAHTAARLNAGLTFATQAGLGLIGGQIFGTAGRFFGRVVKSAGSDLATETMADLTGRGPLLKPFVKSVAAGAVEAPVVGGAQAAGSAAIENAYGIDRRDPLQAAIDQAPAMLGLAAITAPFGLAARAVRASTLAARADALASKDTAPQIRDQLAAQYFVELHKADPEAARHFAINAETAIRNKMPLELDKGLFQEGTVRAPTPTLALPSPYDFVGGPGGVGHDAEAVRAAAAAGGAPEGPRALPAPPSVPALPRPGLAAERGVTQAEAEARRAADENVARIQADRAAEENRKQLEQTHAQVVEELRQAGIEPTQALPFAQFRDAMAKEAKKAGLKASDITPDQYRSMWEQHQADVRNENFDKAQRHAFQLAEDTRSKLPTSAGPAPKTALASALEDAFRQHQVNEAFRQREREQATAKEKQLDQIQNVTKGEQLAAAAEKGAVPANTKTVPATAERVVGELRKAKAADQGMPPKLIKEISAAVSGKKSLEEQLTAIRTLRDAKSPTTASYELLDKLHTALGGEHAAGVESTGSVLRNPPSGSVAQVAKGSAREHQGVAPAREAEGKGRGETAGAKAGGRTKGSTDDRHTIGPPNEVGELLPYSRTLSQAREGAGGIFGEKQWWQDLAWAVQHPTTKIGKELLENGKFTNEQMGEAIARDERYQRADAMLEQMRAEREKRQREQLLAEAQPEKAKEILKSKDLANIFGGEASDYEFDKRANTAEEKEANREDHPNVVAALKGGLHSVHDILSALQRVSIDPAEKVVIDILRSLNLDTRIVRVNRTLRMDDGRIGLARYYGGQDAIIVGRGGATVETVLHEVVHAATVPRMLDAFAKLQNIIKGVVSERSLSDFDRRQVQAARDMMDLVDEAQDRHARERFAQGDADFDKKPLFYGLENPLEFVAEALSDGQFQDWLRSQRTGAKTLWQRFVDFIKAMLGKPVDTTMLDRALTITQEFMSNQKVNPESAEAFSKSPILAREKTDLVLDRAVKIAEMPLSIKQGFTKAHLFVATLNHIRQVFKDVLPEPFKNALDEYGSAKDRTRAMVEERNRTALEISRQMAALGDKAQQLYRLMGEATRQGVFPDRPLEQQPWKHTPEKVRKYNELRQVYQSNPDIAKAYDAAARYNKEDYDRMYATLVRNIARYSDMPRELWKKIDVTKGRSADVEALEKWLLANGNDEQRVAMRGALAQYREKQQGPYFHLGRNGSYFTRFTIKDNLAARAAYEKEFGISPLATEKVIAPEDRHVFSRFEQVGEWKSVTDKLNKLMAAGHLEPEMQTGQLETTLSRLDSSTPSFVRGLLRNIEADTRLDPDQKEQAADILRRLTIEMLPETSASKAFAQRKGVAGYDVDMNRNFVKRAASTAYFVAHNSIRPEVEDSLVQLKQGVQALQDAQSGHYDPNRGLVAAALQDEIKRRQANELVPAKTPMLDNVSALSHSFYLAANPAFFMMKTLQPWQLALPQLGARHGFVKSFSAMTKATATALGIIKDTIGDGWQRGQWRGILDPNIVIDRSRATTIEKEFMRELIAAGGATFTQAHDMGRIAAGDSQGVSTTVKAANASLHFSEALDRLTAGLAAFNLEYKRTGDFDKATQYGIQMVKNSLYDYNTHNRGRAFTKQGVFGPATPMLTQFAQYQIQTLELLGRLTMSAFGKITSEMTAEERGRAIQERSEARRALAGVMATTMVLSGTMGLPATTIITAAYNKLFGTQDQPADAENDYRNFLSDTFGKDAGEIIAHGALRAVGTDLGASHLGMQDIMPFSRFLADRRRLQDRFDSGAIAMMGPSVGAVGGFAMGLQNMLQGRYMKGLEEMVPSGLKGVTKAIDLEEHGLTDLRGNKLPVDINSWDIFNQLLNSTPAKVAEQREAQRSANTTTMLLKQRASDLKENFAVAYERGDAADMERLTNEIVAFNRVNPDYAIRDLAGILRQRAMERAVADQAAVEGKVKQLPRLQADQRFANIGGRQ